MSVIVTDVLVGEIVRLYPATLKVFARCNLDLCCEAGLPLGDAARKHELDPDQLLRELNEAIEAQATVK
ncbi:MAG: DUF542 domain-containing protein [Terriglobia bacterium]